jgi:hypothetical protein
LGIRLREFTATIAADTDPGSHGHGGCRSALPGGRAGGARRLGH